CNCIRLGSILTVISSWWNVINHRCSPSSVRGGTSDVLRSKRRNRVSNCRRRRKCTKNTILDRALEPYYHTHASRRRNGLRHPNGRLHRQRTTRLPTVQNVVMGKAEGARLSATSKCSEAKKGALFLSLPQVI